LTSLPVGEYSGNKKIDYNGIHREEGTMDAFSKKLLARLMAMAVIASLFTGLVMTGTAGGQPPTCPLDEDFSGGVPPSGWTTDDWVPSGTNWAGGTSPEAELIWYEINGDYAYLDSQPVDTTGMWGLTLEFKSFIDYWEYGSCNFACRVYTRVLAPAATPSISARTSALPRRCALSSVAITLT
jgi:hypothetical protein